LLRKNKVTDKIFLNYLFKRIKGYSDFLSIGDYMLKVHFFTFFMFLFLFPGFGFTEQQAIEVLQKHIEALEKSYPDITFSYIYDDTINEYLIELKGDQVEGQIYWANGSYLNRDQLARKDKYRQLLYPYAEKLRDPADFTEEEIERITQFSSTENRRSGRIAGTTLFDIIYDSETREDAEKHIEEIAFLGYNLSVHHKIIPFLKNVEQKISIAASEDPEIAAFVSELGSISGYSWRNVRDSGGKSFHSMGLALDIQPVDLNGKAIYWNWEKNSGNDLWMMLPLEERWIPPMTVIQIFESEGFIWGGMWPIWDNMHFEYRPELLEWRDSNNNF